MCHFHAKNLYEDYKQPVLVGLGPQYLWRLDDDSYIFKPIGYDVFRLVHCHAFYSFAILFFAFNEYPFDLLSPWAHLTRGIRKSSERITYYFTPKAVGCFRSPVTFTAEISLRLISVRHMAKQFAFSATFNSLMPTLYEFNATPLTAVSLSTPISTPWLGLNRTLNDAVTKHWIRVDPVTTMKYSTFLWLELTRRRGSPLSGVSMPTDRFFLSNSCKLICFLLHYTLCVR